MQRSGTEPGNQRKNLRSTMTLADEQMSRFAAESWRWVPDSIALGLASSLHASGKGVTTYLSAYTQERAKGRARPLLHPASRNRCANLVASRERVPFPRLLDSGMRGPRKANRGGEGRERGPAPALGLPTGHGILTKPFGCGWAFSAKRRTIAAPRPIASVRRAPRLIGRGRLVSIPGFLSGPLSM